MYASILVVEKDSKVYTEDYQILDALSDLLYYLDGGIAGEDEYTYTIVVEIENEGLYCYRITVQDSKTIESILYQLSEPFSEPIELDKHIMEYMEEDTPEGDIARLLYRLVNDY